MRSWRRRRRRRCCVRRRLERLLPLRLLPTVAIPLGVCLSAELRVALHPPAHHRR